MLSALAFAALTPSAALAQHPPPPPGLLEKEQEQGGCGEVFGLQAQGSLSELDADGDGIACESGEVSFLALSLFFAICALLWGLGMVVRLAVARRGSR